MYLIGFLHFATNEWSFVVKQNVRCQQNIASIYSRINITRAIETRIVRSQEAGERVTDRSIGNARELQGERLGRGRRNNNGSANESERLCECVNHNQLLTIITAENEANRVKCKYRARTGGKKKDYHEDRHATQACEI